MTEPDIIKSAFEDQIRAIFNIFFNAYTTANNDQDKALAEQRFRAGILAARAIRDKALALVP